MYSIACAVKVAWSAIRTRPPPPLPTRSRGPRGTGLGSASARSPPAHRGQRREVSGRLSARAPASTTRRATTALTACTSRCSPISSRSGTATAAPSALVAEATAAGGRRSRAEPCRSRDGRPTEGASVHADVPGVAVGVQRTGRASAAGADGGLGRVGRRGGAGARPAPTVVRADAAARHLGVGQDGVDLPRRPVGVVHPHLVLGGVAARDALLAG